MAAKQQLSVAKLSTQRIFHLPNGIPDFLVAKGRMAADFSSPVRKEEGGGAEERTNNKKEGET